MANIASHLPLLCEIGAALPIRTILEFGAGCFSTPTFLDRAIFPHCVRLDSYEHNPTWLAGVRALTSDPRLTLHHIPDETFVGVLHDTPFADYDLIFIDNGTTTEARLPTIRGIGERRPLGLCVVHDYEQSGVHEAAKAWDVAIPWDDNDGGQCGLLANLPTPDWLSASWLASLL